MTNKDVEQQLQEFLAWQERSRKEGKTVEALHEKNDAIMRAVRRIAKDRLEDKETLHRYGRAIKTLQHQVGLLTEASPAVPDWRAPKDETTGTHSLKDIAKAQAELEERLDAEEERKVEEETWWRRQRWLWFGAAVAAFFGIIMTGCVGYVAYRIQAIEKSINEHPPAGR